LQPLLDPTNQETSTEATPEGSVTCAVAVDVRAWERVLDRLEVITSTYSNAGLRAILFDIGGLIVLSAFAIWARLYERGQLLLLARRGRALAQH
jgi:hypothetical protein